ncbi:MAG: UDP-N-acetylmuramate--L-alanine ligase [candidate division WOR-3 bacterium]
MFARINHIHFVGIGGAGMSGLAIILKNLGYHVTGSDLVRTSLTEHLRQLGIKVAYRHHEQNCYGANVVVYSTAINKHNPEIQYALKHKIPVIPRAEMLAELMRVKFSIAVSGTHGKTTTTSLISAILEQAQLHPTIIIGGKVVGLNSTAKLGKSEYLVAEADESDRSFLLLYPTLAVITNIEREHLDYYKNIQEIKNAFIEFANKVPFFGSVIVCHDCPQARNILPHLKREVITYGLTKQAMVYAQNIQLNNFNSRFTVFYNHTKFNCQLNLGGEHNIQNALAAICVALKLKIPIPTIKNALANFQGIERRLQFKGRKNNITIYDDYGHHPTEIRATLQTLRNAYPQQRIITVFQPHRYTRTKLLGNDFGKAFNHTDLLIITDIYAASEKKIPKVSSQIIVDAIKKQNQLHPQVIYKKTFAEIVNYLKANIKQNDVIITLGAGNIWQVGETLLKTL